MEADSKPVPDTFFWVFVFGAIGAVIGVCILAPWPWATPEVSKNTIEAFMNTKEFDVWRVIVLITASLFLVLPLPAWTSLKKLWEDTSIDPRPDTIRLGISAVILLILFALPFIVEPILACFDKLEIPRKLSRPLPGHNLRVLILPIIGALGTLLPASLGIWLLQAAIEKKDSLNVKDYLRFREQLQQLLLILGVILGLAVLVTGAERLALTALMHPFADLIKGENPLRFNLETAYPAIRVLASGAYLTMLVALIYVPTFASFRKVGLELVNKLLPPSDKPAKGWETYNKERKALEELLQVKVSARKSLETMVPLLLPLLGGLTSTLLG